MTDLSPAAQAVKDAVLTLDPDRKTFKWVWSLYRPIAAAAIRAVVKELKCFGITEKNILDIATELEGTN